MRADASLHADPTRRQIGQSSLDLATRPLLPQYDSTALILANDVERVLADIDADYIGRSVELLWHGVLLVFGAPCQHSLPEGREHGRTILLAVLPHMRAQMSGHIIQVSSIAGITTFPDLGLYSASKWGLEGFSRSLALEVAEFGIKLTIVEPSAFKTNGRGTFVVRATPLPAYDGTREAIARIRGNIPQGDPEATGAALLAVIDAEEPPLAEAPAVLDIEIHETGTIAYGRIDTLPPVSTQFHLSAAG